MARFDPEVLKIVKRLQMARLELMRKQPFYALLLMHMKFALDLTCETAYTDGERIAFNPDFIKELDNQELQFVLMHEVLHVALQHCFRHQSDYDAQAFDLACDIVVNSNILYSFEGNLKRITLKKYGEMMHKTPNGQEGYLFSAEEVYKWVLIELEKQRAAEKQKQKCTDRDESSEDDDSEDNCEDGSNGGIGGKGRGKGNKRDGSDEGTEDVDSDEEGDEDDSGSNTDDANEDVGAEKPDPRQFDDHSFWDGDDEEHTQRSTWLNRMVNATQLMKSIQGDSAAGSIPAGMQRELLRLTQSQLDWKTILNDFIQEEINDYSFSPPDRRFEDSPFFLPDYNEKDERAEDILFMIDTSGSMTEGMITQAYSEIKGAIDQFNGKLKGWLGFFDAVVVPPIPFEDEEEFKVIRPFGGGGTSFQCVLDYVRDEMQDKLPASIIYLTDGFAPWPDENDAMGIPVLWLINNEEVEPPWGKVARIPPDLSTE
jgi:predicted metal-dependent peptidase